MSFTLLKSLKTETECENMMFKTIFKDCLLNLTILELLINSYFKFSYFSDVEFKY